MCNLNIGKKIQKMIKNGMKLLFEHRMSKFKNNTGQLSDVKLNLIPGMGLAHHQLQFGIIFFGDSYEVEIFHSFPTFD